MKIGPLVVNFTSQSSLHGVHQVFVILIKTQAATGCLLACLSELMAAVFRADFTRVHFF